jgi:Concanavalin A-like lectin/glucanases superfamily
VGQALSFTPARGTYVEIADVPNLNPTGAMSVAAWIKLTDVVGNRRVLQKGQMDDQYRLLVEQGQLKFHLATTTGGLATGLLPPEARWVHVAGSYDGAIVRLYVDGTEAGSGPASGPIKVTADPLRIGTKIPLAPAGDFWAGQLDEVLLYGRALSPSEIRALAGGALP